MYSFFQHAPSTDPRISRRSHSNCAPSKCTPVVTSRLDDAYLLLGHLDLALGNLVGQVLGVHAVHGAADGEGRAEHLLDRAGERLGERLVPELACHLDDLIERHVAIVLDCT